MLVKSISLLLLIVGCIFAEDDPGFFQKGETVGPPNARDRYYIERVLGSGRYGAVYLAKRDDNQVALKVLHEADSDGTSEYNILVSLDEAVDVEEGIFHLDNGKVAFAMTYLSGYDTLFDATQPKRGIVFRSDQNHSSKDFSKCKFRISYDTGIEDGNLKPRIFSYKDAMTEIRNRVPLAKLMSDDIIINFIKEDFNDFIDRKLVDKYIQEFETNAIPLRYDSSDHHASGNCEIDLKIVFDSRLYMKSKRNMTAKGFEMFLRKAHDSIFELHKRGIYHEDTDNLLNFLVKFGETEMDQDVKLIDFGMAKFESYHAQAKQNCFSWVDIYNYNDCETRYFWDYKSVSNSLSKACLYYMLDEESPLSKAERLELALFARNLMDSHPHEALSRLMDHVKKRQPPSKTIDDADNQGSINHVFSWGIFLASQVVFILNL